jgi:polysaccharide deacetylase 2 family uncharacterized protein YibQ
VADDELSAPLGQNTKKKRTGRRLTLPIRVPHVIAGVLGLFVCACAVWALVVDEPLGGEPIAVIATGFDGPRDAARPASAIPVVSGTAAQGPRSYDGPGKPAVKQVQVPSPVPAQAPPAAAAAAAPNTKTVTIIDGSTGKRQEVAIPATRDVRAPLEQRLLETSRHGGIPRIASDGARPADVYARAVKPAPGRKDGPQIAIVIGGLGISASVTEQAMKKLPGAVTFAFSPYGADVERLTTNARAEGHEILLQTPMEPFDYPDNDPGPQTLLTTLSTEQNIDRLHWLMSRFQGYVGIANSMGARFTANEQALGPVLKETARRGLIYVDDGSSPRSVSGQIANANTLPFAKAEVILDAVPATAHIDRALAKLEALAKERGSAVGIASALPASIERIAQWAKAAEARGIVLVPITAVAIKPKSS